MNKICFSISTTEKTVPVFRLPSTFYFEKRVKPFSYKWVWGDQGDSWRTEFISLPFPHFLLGHFTETCFCFLQGNLPTCHNIIISKMRTYFFKIRYLLSRSIKISIGIGVITTLLLILNGIIRLVKIRVKLSQVWHPEK